MRSNAIAAAHRSGTLFDEMAKVHGPSLLSWALARSCQPSDAWDLLQDTFERALRSQPAIADQGELRRWLVTVLRNRHLDERRAAAVRRVAGDFDVESVPAANVDPEESWQRVDHGQVLALVLTLRSPLRETFLLLMEGESTDTIARRLRIRRGTVATRAFRARRRLREMFESRATPAE